MFNVNIYFNLKITPHSQNRFFCILGIVAPRYASLHQHRLQPHFCAVWLWETVIHNNQINVSHSLAGQFGVENRGKRVAVCEILLINLISLVKSQLSQLSWYMNIQEDYISAFYLTFYLTNSDIIILFYQLQAKEKLWQTYCCNIKVLLHSKLFFAYWYLDV